MKRGHRLRGWALLLLGAPSACGGDAAGSAAAGASGPGGGATSVTASVGAAGGYEKGNGGGSAGAGAGAGGEGAGGEGAGGEGGEGAGAGSGPTGECAVLPAGPIEPVRVTDVFSGSEDFAFDGQGHLVARQGPNLIRFDATGRTSNFASLRERVLGLRYRPDGTLVAALPDMGAVVQISTAGVVSDYVEGLTAPNGLSPDAEGNVWATETAADRVIRLGPDGAVSVIASGAPAVSQPDGVLFDPARRVVFYTNAAAGEIRRIDAAAPGAAPALVTTVAGAELAGLALDVCGHLYVVDGKGATLYRVRLDRGGAAAEEPELFASFPTAVSNAQFGAGPGFDAKALYVGGAPGSIYAVTAGIAGAQVPTPPRAP
ncbi:SMP-30/gluconolactonase/LRE family protein [Sorangium sp. So ce1036]|uniref:SMP-30/gluconolactonase/LRE family protein n=1 Tax=Sorangium sp. So ce1036 TaxID=3133328 RepID=UPI003F00DE61